MSLSKPTQGEIVWRLEQNADTNERYKSIKSNVQRLVRQAHDLLRSNCAVVGIKAQNDIMKVLSLVIMKWYFADEQSDVMQRCNEMKETIVSYDKYIAYCKDLTLLTKEANVFNCWSMFVKRFLTRVFPAIYFEDDAKFNCTDDTTIIKLIVLLSSLEVDEDFIDAFSTTCGDIHESFRAYGGGKGAKELGQYFTPRHLIHLIFHGLGLQDIVKDMDDVTIYDPCMGTGGFLTRMFNLGNVKPENVYGCETEQDTIKFGEASMLLTTKSVNTNIAKCDSLCENPFLMGKKMKVIVTNPPFGTKMKYKDLKTKFETNFPNSPVLFKEIYPIEVNNGACLFIQHCVYMLAEGGVCAIVLPDGELFDGNGKWPKAFRKWWCEAVNILKLLKVPSGTFEHAGVKTNVVVFVKNGPTQEIQYLQTNKECNVVTVLGLVSRTSLQEKDFTLAYDAYEAKKRDEYGVSTKSLKEVCEIDLGTRIVKKTNTPGIYPVYGSGNQTFTTTTCNREEYNIVVGRFALSPECVRIVNMPLFLNDSGLTIRPKDHTILHEFLGYYMMFNQDKVYNCTKGQAQQNLDMQAFQELSIPVPPIATQKQIVEELSFIEKRINNIKESIKDLAIEKELYTKHGRTTEICELLKDCDTKPLHKVCMIKYGTRVVKKNVQPGTYPVIGSGNETFTTTTYNRNGFNVVIGRFAVSNECVRLLDKSFFLNDSGLTLEPSNNDVTLEFIGYYWLFNQDMIFNCAKGQAQLNLGMDAFKELPMHTPCLDVQKKCIDIYKEKEAYLQKVDKKIEKENQHIEELKQLGKDIIASYCT